MLPLPIQRNYTGEGVVGAPAFGDPARPPVLSSTYSGDMYFTDKLNEIYSSIHPAFGTQPSPGIIVLELLKEAGVILNNHYNQNEITAIIGQLHETGTKLHSMNLAELQLLVDDALNRYLVDANNQIDLRRFNSEKDPDMVQDGGRKLYTQKKLKKTKKTKKSKKSKKTKKTKKSKKTKGRKGRKGRKSTRTSSN